MEDLPFDQRDGYIWYDGKFVEWKDAKIHLLNHGLQYGSCVFEGERIYNGQIFKSRDHIKRLFQSADLLDIDIKYTEEEIFAAKKELVRKQGVKTAYMKMFAWKGCDKMTIEYMGGTSHLAIAMWEIHSDYSKQARIEGIKVCTSKWRRPDPRTFPINIKFSGAYVVNALSKHEAIKKGYDDAILLDYKGHVSEGSASNIFFVDGKELHTPAKGCFLDGLTRRAIIDLAKNRGIKVIEREILPEEIKDFDGAFLTGTAVEVTPIVQFDDIKFDVQDITKDLVKDYQDLVHKRSQN